MICGAQGDLGNPNSILQFPAKSAEIIGCQEFFLIFPEFVFYAGETRSILIRTNISIVSHLVAMAQFPTPPPKQFHNSGSKASALMGLRYDVTECSFWCNTGDLTREM